MGFWVDGFCIRYLYNVKNQFFSEIMIKQSFLRNYNLAKIQSEAEDQKKKLQVFYSRQVEKIIKQRRQMDKEQFKQMAFKQHRDERVRLKERIQEMKENRCSEDRDTGRRTRINRKSPDIEQPASVQQKKKVDLFISDLQLKSYLTSSESTHQSLKITTVPNRTFHKKMLHSIMSKLKEFNGLDLSDHGKPLERLKKMKFKTNPSFHDSLESFNFNHQKSTQARILNKLRMKRTETSKILLKKRSSQTDIGMSVLNSPKFNLKFINELKSKGFITRQIQQDPE